MPYQSAEILFDKYRIEAFIGRGSCGEVYRVTHLELGRVCALKVLDPDVRGISDEEFQEYRNRFHLEAQLGVLLNQEEPNPHLLQVYDHRDQIERPYLEMEFAPGGNLASRIKTAGKDEKAIPVEEVVKMGVEVAVGLGALHAKEIVHRDLKPENILFDQKGRAKLADLGLAQTREEYYDRMRMSVPPKHPGAQAYKSPEQKAGGEGLTPASDVYALGAVLFEALTGVMYFGQPRGKRASDLRPEVPQWLDELLVRMLEVNPGQRLVSGAQVSELLQEGDEKTRQAKIVSEAKEKDSLEGERLTRQAALQENAHKEELARQKRLAEEEEKELAEKHRAQSKKEYRRKAKLENQADNRSISWWKRRGVQIAIGSVVLIILTGMIFLITNLPGTAPQTSNPTSTLLTLPNTNALIKTQTLTRAPSTIIESMPTFSASYWAAPWAIEYLYVFSPGFWTEGIHQYRLVSMGTNCDNVSEVIQFQVSNAAQLLDENVYIRYGQLKSASGTRMDTIHPQQVTAADLYYYGETQTEIENIMRDCKVTILVDNSIEYSLTAYGPYRQP